MSLVTSIAKCNEIAFTKYQKIMALKGCKIPNIGIIIRHIFRICEVICRVGVISLTWAYLPR